MRTLLPWLLMILASALVTGCEEEAPAPAAGAATTGAATTGAPARANAGDTYREVAERLKPREVNLAAGSVSFGSGGVKVDSSAGSWERVAGLLRAEQATVQELMRAAALERCDLGLPPLSALTNEAEQLRVLTMSGYVRAIARLLHADAVRCWSEGDLEGATDRLGALYGFCTHVSREPLLLTAMTNAAVLGLTHEAVGALVGGVDGKALTRAQRARLLAAMERLDAQDPSGLGRARRAEAEAGSDERIATAESRINAQTARTRRSLGR